MLLRLRFPLAIVLVFALMAAFVISIRDEIVQAGALRYDLHLLTSETTFQNVERIHQRLFRTAQGRSLILGDDETYTLSESN